MTIISKVVLSVNPAEKAFLQNKGAKHPLAMPDSKKSVIWLH